MSPITSAWVGEARRLAETSAFWFAERISTSRKRTKAAAALTVLLLHAVLGLLIVSTLQSPYLLLREGYDGSGFSVGLVGSPATVPSRMALKAASDDRSGKPSASAAQAPAAATAPAAPEPSESPPSAEDKATAAGEGLWGQAAAGAGKVELIDDPWAKASIITTVDISTLTDSRLRLQVEPCWKPANDAIPVSLVITLDHTGAIVGEPVPEGETATSKDEAVLRAVSDAKTAAKSCSPYVVASASEAEGAHHLSFGPDPMAAGAKLASGMILPTEAELKLP